MKLLLLFQKIIIIILFIRKSKRSIKVFRGSEKNVLNRYFKASQYYKSDIIVRITGDCPLVDHELVDTMLKKFLKNKIDFMSNNDPPTFLMDLI